MWKELWTRMWSLLRDPRFFIPVLLVLIAGYGYFLTNYSVSIDDLAVHYYVYEDGGSFSQGRATYPPLMILLGLSDGEYYFSDVFGLMVLVFAVLLCCSMIQYFSADRIKVIPNTIFACLFLSYPLYSELFTYSNCVLAFGVTLLLVETAICFAYCGIENRRFSSLVGAAVIMLLVTSYWEIGVVLFILMVLAFFSIRTVYDPDSQLTLKRLLKRGIVYAVVLSISVAVEGPLSRGLATLLGYSTYTSYSQSIAYSVVSVSSALKGVILNGFFNYVVKAIWYLPIFIALVAVAIFVVIAIVDIAKRHSGVLSICYLGMFLSLFLLCIYQGFSTPYRVMSILLGFLIAFVGMTLSARTQADKAKPAVRIAILIFLAFVIFWQTENLNHWFVLEDQRYEDERTTIEQLGETLVTKYDAADKPVVFVGTYQMSDYIMDRAYVRSDDARLQLLESVYHFSRIDLSNTYCIPIQESSVLSVLSWEGTTGSDFCRDFLDDYFSLCGYDIAEGTEEQYKDAVQRVSVGGIPNYTQDGGIVDVGDYILVNLG